MGLSSLRERCPRRKARRPRGRQTPHTRGVTRTTRAIEKNSKAKKLTEATTQRAGGRAAGMGACSRRGGETNS